jgi:hypothetical protein
MALHLIKLCVGIDTVDHLRERQAIRLRNEGALSHVTRMTPRRGARVLDGGSLYWVIKRLVQVRQRIIGLEPVTGQDSIRRCAIMLDRELVATRPQPRRAFQGWRYLRAEDAPLDLPHTPGLEDMPPQMRADLMELGLI